MVYRTFAAICLYSSLLVPDVAQGGRTLLFSGTVAEFEAKWITVHGKSSTHVPVEKKTFVITGATKIEGELRLSARVTIGFVPSDQGDVATRIIVRPSTPKKN